jgi:cobalt/nickel transport protein
MKRQNGLLLLGTVALAIGPLMLIKPSEGHTEIFTGSDSQAEAAINVIQPGYKPWFSPLWEPPSKEIESLLFGLQAAIGAAAIGYCLGFHRGRNKPTHVHAPNR